MDDWSARRTRNPAVQVQVKLWPLAGFVLGHPEFKSLATLVNSQLAAPASWGFKSCYVVCELFVF